MVVGSAINWTVGAMVGGGFGLVTVTTTAEVAVAPPPPLAVAVYVVVVDGETTTDPEVPFTPMPGSISTDVALDEFHDKVVV